MLLTLNKKLINRLRSSQSKSKIYLIKAHQVRKRERDPKVERATIKGI